MNEDTYRDKLNDLQLEVEELRAKLKEAQTGDLISRQAAIDLIKNDAFWVQYAWGGRGHKPEMEMVDDLVESIIKQMKESVMSRLKQMPSAQPEERTETHACDLISRQAAIDALTSTAGVGNRALDKIRALPSAQHEPIRLRLDHELSKEEYERLKKDCAEQPIILLPKESAQQWIPCSERLPGDLSEVNVTWINHNPEPYFEFSKDKPFTATAVYYKDKWYWYSATCADFLAEYGKCDWNEVDDAIEIVAWMPLPEPYAERRTDETD